MSDVTDIRIYKIEKQIDELENGKKDKESKDDEYNRKKSYEKLMNWLKGMLITAGLLSSGTYADLEHPPSELLEPVTPAEPPRDVVKDCAMNLLESVGKKGVASLPDLYRKHSREQDTEFLEYMFSVMYVESRFDKMAVSPADAYGLMQMTRIAVDESVKHCDLRPLADMNKLHDSVTNIRYGTCFLKKVLTEVDGDWTRALILYNGGYRQLTRYDNGESITSETSNYVLLVNRALNKICRAPRE